MSAEPTVGAWVRGFDGYTRQTGQVVEPGHLGGVLVDTVGGGRAILTDVAFVETPSELPQ